MLCEAGVFEGERAGLIASAGQSWMISPHMSQGHCQVTQECTTHPHWGISASNCPGFQSQCVLEDLTLIHPLLAMCYKNRHLPLLLRQQQLWIFIAATILASMSVTVAHLLKARVQIIANLAFNMADNWGLVLFHKLYFFHMKMNGVKLFPALWGSDFCSREIGYKQKNKGCLKACLEYFLPWISKWMC